MSVGRRAPDLRARDLEGPPRSLDWGVGLALVVVLAGLAWWVLDSYQDHTNRAWRFDRVVEMLWLPARDALPERPGADGAPPLPPVPAREAGPGILLRGLWVTLQISALSIVGGMVIGVLLGMGSVGPLRSVRGAALGLVELVRGTPLLVQIYVVAFFVGPALGVQNRFWLGVLAMTVFVSAYISEIVRAGIESVEPGQVEAARSLGLSRRQTLRDVVLPQALRTMVPPLTGVFMSQIKDSSLVSVIAVGDLTKRAQEQAAASLANFEVWFTAALLYLLLTIPLTVLTRALQRRMGGDS